LVGNTIPEDFHHAVLFVLLLLAPFQTPTSFPTACSWIASTIVHPIMWEPKFYTLTEQEEMLCQQANGCCKLHFTAQNMHSGLPWSVST
jgi:hypothetical protein